MTSIQSQVFAQFCVLFTPSVAHEFQGAAVALYCSAAISKAAMSIFDMFINAA